MQRIEFVQDLRKEIYKYKKQKFSNIVILCVGTNKLVGDSVGPMVGNKLENMLSDKYLEKIAIYGNMNKTLNFQNAFQIIDNLKQYRQPFIITIDAALGSEEMIEKLFINSGKIQIGKSLGHSICYNSHINVKGVVGKYNSNLKENIRTLKMVKYQTIERLSGIVAYGIDIIIKEISISKNV